MGFPSEDVTRALQATGNNYEAACAWLLGDHEEVLVHYNAHSRLT